MSTLSTNNLTDLATGDTVPAKYLVHGSAKGWYFGGSTFITNSLNLSSLTDHASGDNSLAFVNGFSGRNYSASTSAEVVSTSAYATSLSNNHPYRSGSASIFTFRTSWASTVTASTSFYTGSHNSITIHGDLA
jgi:hypothetical protein